MSELIDRQAAIDKLRNNITYMQAFGCDRAITLIRELPSVQPDRKTSEWLHEYLQTAVDFGIITETQASRLMDMIDDSEDNA